MVPTDFLPSSLLPMCVLQIQKWDDGGRDEREICTIIVDDNCVVFPLAGIVRPQSLHRPATPAVKTEFIAATSSVATKSSVFKATMSTAPPSNATSFHTTTGNIIHSSRKHEN